MKRNEIKGMDSNALDERLLEIKKELIKINAQIAIGTAPKNPGQVKKLKKTIARIMTFKKGKLTNETEVKKKYE